MAKPEAAADTEPLSAEHASALRKFFRIDFQTHCAAVAVRELTEEGRRLHQALRDVDAEIEVAQTVMNDGPKLASVDGISTALAELPDRASRSAAVESLRS